MTLDSAIPAELPARKPGPLVYFGLDCLMKALTACCPNTSDGILLFRFSFRTLFCFIFLFFSSFDDPVGKSRTILIVVHVEAGN